VIDGCESHFPASRNADSIDLSYIRNPNALRDSDYFHIEFYAVEGTKEYLVAEDKSTIRVTQNQLTPGNITQLKVTNIGSN